MRIGVYSDSHFSLNSSIILGQKGTMDGRLDHLIRSFEWMYEVFDKAGVDIIVDGGDLTDSHILRSEEITAITAALAKKKSLTPEYHLLGNHERLAEDGKINSINFIESYPTHSIVRDVSMLNILGEDIMFIPYGHYNTGDFDEFSTKVCFSHIDIFGADSGGWKFKSGLDPYYLAKQFDLTINGHIHNPSWVVPNKVINIGAISGQNFSSKNTYWNPSIGILDTETMELQLIENPHALRFETIDCNTFSSVMKKINAIDENVTHAVQIRVPIEILEDVRNLLESKSHIISSRVTIKLTESELGGLTREEVDKVTSIGGGFEKLVEYLNEQESLPYQLDDVLLIVKELEEGTYK